MFAASQVATLSLLTATSPATSSAPPDPSVPAPTFPPSTGATHRPVIRSHPAYRSFCRRHRQSIRQCCTKWLRPRKPVAVVQEKRVSRERRGICHQIWHNHHIRRILHQYSCVAMIRMIIIETGRDHDICLPLANLADDLLANFL